MKLHLPTRLRAAVLACITAVAALSTTIGTGVLTTGAVAYTFAAAGVAYAGSLTTTTTEIEGVTYSGGVYTLASTGNISASTITADANSADGSITAGSTAAWGIFASNQSGAYGHTMHLTQAGTFTSNFSPFSIGGLIVDAGLADGVTIGRENTATEIVGNGAANMTIKSDATILGNAVKEALKGVTVKTGGTWTIASDKTLTLSATNQGVTLTDDVTVTVAGSGAVVINAATTTLNQGASFAVGSEATLNLAGTVNVLNDSVEESDIPTDSNGYSQMTGSATAVTIAEGGTLNADGVTWQLNGLAANYSNGVVSQSGESSKYYVNIDADLADALDTKTSDVIIRNGATFNITNHTGGSAGMIKGNVLVKEGSTLKLSSGDALGWSGGNHVSVLTVENGATVNVNHGGNETFGGTLNLSGTLTGIAGSKWDFFTNSSLTIGEGAQASISVGQLRLRRAGTVFTMGADSTLDISSQIINGAGGDGVLTVNGNGTLNLTGGASISNLTLRKGGENNISTTAATFTKFYLGGGTTNISTTVNAGQVRLDENGSATLNINEGGVLNITGTNNDHSTDASLMLNHWGHTSTMVLNGGELNAETIDMHLSWDGTGVFQANAGTAKVQGISAWTHQDNQCRGKILLGSATEGSAKLIIGENGIGDFADQAVLKLGNGTLGASADWSLRYNTSHTESKAEFIATTETGTIIDTTKVGGEEGAGATITFKNGTTGVGNMTVQGTGSLVLEGASDRTGNTTIAGGTLVAKEVSSLGTGAVTVAGGTLVLDTEDTITLGSLAMTSGAIKLAGAEKLAVTGAVTLSGGTLDLTNLADVITGAGTTVLGTVGGEVTGGTIAVSGLADSIISQYSFSVSKDGENLVLTAANASSPLFWNGGDGNWSSDPTDNGWGTTGDDESTGDVYAAGSSVTISGSEGGTITVKGAQTAASLTIAHSGYTIAKDGTGSLTITGDLTVDANVSSTLNFLPTLGENGHFVVNEGATLSFGINNPQADVLGVLLDKGTGDGLIVVKDGGMIVSPAGGYTLNVNMKVDGGWWLNGPANNARTLTIAEDKTLTLTGKLSLNSSMEVIVDGGNLVAGEISLGHSGATGYKGTLHLISGEVTTGFFTFTRTDTANLITIDGGTLTVTGNEHHAAFTEPDEGNTELSVVSISSATLTNGESDLAFNHGSTLTDATITATPADAAKSQAATTITMGGEGKTTTIAKADSAQSASLTTNGNVVIAGTTSVSGATTLTSNGSLTVNSLSAAEGTTLTTAGSGSTTISAGSVDKIVANGTTTLGNVTVKNISGTITQATGTTLTLADGATLDGTASIGAATAAGSLTKTGTGTVTTGAITGTNTALTVSGGTLSTGAVSNLTTVSVAQGATLASTGDVTATGAATINGTFNGGSLTATSITVAEGASIGSTTALTATKTAQENTGVVTLNDSITLSALTADTVTLAADKTLTVSGAANITNLALGSIGETPAVSFGSLTSSAMAVDVAITTLHDYFDSAAEGTTSVTIATLGAASSATLSLVHDKGSGYDYSIALDSSNNIVISRNFSGIVWDGASGAEWGQGGSWDGGNVPGATDNVSFIGNEGTAVTPTVTIAAGGVTAGSVSVTGSEMTSADYTFTGGSLTAADLLVENGSLSIENESAFTSGSVEATGSLTVNDAAASLEIGTLTVKGELTIEDGELTVTDTLTTEEDATLAFNGGSSAIGTAAMGSDTIVIKAPASVLVGTVEGEETTVQLAGALNVVKGDIKKIEGIADGGSTTYGDLTVGAVQSLNSLTPTVTNDVAIAEASDVQNLTVTGTGNLAAQDTLHIHGTADVAENGVVTVAKNTTIDGTLTNNGDITIGSETTPATLATAQVTNDGTITVYNTMTATGDVTNKSGAELDVKGALTANEAGKTVENSGTLTVGGATNVTSLTTNAGGTTEAKAGATIGTTLTNHGKTTITGNLVSADTSATTPGSLVISNDATGSGEKLVVSGNVSGASLTTETGATTEISGTATLSGIDNSGTLSTGALTTETLTNNGTLNVTGNAAVKDLSSTNVASQMNVTGTLTIAQGGSLNSDGDITASSLNLSNLAATDKVTVGDLKTDAITLNALSSATEGLTVETLSAKTPGQKVTVSLADSIVEQIASLDESDTAQLVTVTSPASTGKLQLTTAAAQKITTALDKKLLTYAISEDGKLTILDNALDKGMQLSENAQAGMDMVKEAYIAEGGTPTGDLKEITDLLKTYRADNNQAAAEKLTSALSGASVAALGSALSGDVDRQLKAIRNRTTVMGVNQAVVNEGMPYVNAWMNAEGDYRDISADGTMPGYKMSSWGGTVGFDVDCTPTFTCGLAATAMYGDFDSTGDDHATGDLNTYYVSAFGRYASHRWTHTFVATAGLADTSLDRTVGGVKVKGDSEGSMFGGMYEVGYVFALDKEATTCLQPIFNVSYTHATLNGYEETGSDIALKTGDVEMNKLTVGLGARLQSVIGENIYNRSSLFEARALVKFDAGDRQGEITNSFVKYAGTADAKSVETGAVGGEFGMGLTVPVGAEGGNIFMDASAEIRAEYVNVNGTVGYRVNF